MSANRVFIRLHKRKDILRVAREGKRVWGPSFDLIVLRDAGEGLRIAIVVPLLGTNAASRNKLKRRTREALRVTLHHGEVRGDVIVRAKKAAYSKSYSEIVEEIGTTLGLLSERVGDT